MRIARRAVARALSGWLPFVFALSAMSVGCAHQLHGPVPPGGTIVRLPAFRSQFLVPRNVDIWLPPGFRSGADDRYAVLYMHDGQNLFDTTTGFGGMEWGADETMAHLLHAGFVRPAIIVGIWSTPERWTEYAPQKPLDTLPDSISGPLIAARGRPKSDLYLRFLVEELKPRIDRLFPTLPDREHTFVAGSSMGGLVSLYALLEYPDVFGGAACLSTHWPVSIPAFDELLPRAIEHYMDRRLPPRGTVRLYFDFGTATLDSLYEPYQRRVDDLLRRKGYTERDWSTMRFEGAKHNEDAWKARFAIPLRFLIGTDVR